jgi:hypothetical protein
MWRHIQNWFPCKRTKPPHPLCTCMLSITWSALRYGLAYFTPVRLFPRRLLRNCPLPPPHQRFSFDLSLVQCSVESSSPPTPLLQKHLRPPFEKSGKLPSALPKMFCGCFQYVGDTLRRWKPSWYRSPNQDKEATALVSNTWNLWIPCLLLTRIHSKAQILHRNILSFHLLLRENLKSTRAASQALRLLKQFRSPKNFAWIQARRIRNS